jgi:hypothetical protein
LHRLLILWCFEYKLFYNYKIDKKCAYDNNNSAQDKIWKPNRNFPIARFIKHDDPMLHLKNQHELVEEFFAADSVNNTELSKKFKYLEQYPKNIRQIILKT